MNALKLRSNLRRRPRVRRGGFVRPGPRNGRVQSVAKALEGLPPFCSDFSLTKKFRFQALSSGVTAQNISYQQMSQIFGVATSSTNVSCLMEALQIVKVEVWGAASSNNSPSTVTAEWGIDNYVSSNATLLTDTSLSPTVAPHIKLVPAAGSNASMWHNFGDSSNAVVLLSAPQYSVLDLTLRFSFFADGGGPNNVTSSGLTTSYTYFGHLDGPGGNWAPIGPYKTF